MEAEKSAFTVLKAMSHEEKTELLSKVVLDTFSPQQVVSFLHQLRQMDHSREAWLRRMVLQKAREAIDELDATDDFTARDLCALRDDFSSGFDAIMHERGGDSASREIAARSFEAAFLIGVAVGHGDLPVKQLKQFGRASAAHAREARAAKPKEKIILAAIEAERGIGPAANAWKEAGAICSAVTARVESHGFGVVSQSAI